MSKSTLKYRFFSKRLKIKQNTAKIGAVPKLRLCLKDRVRCLARSSMTHQSIKVKFTSRPTRWPTHHWDRILYLYLEKLHFLKFRLSTRKPKTKVFKFLWCGMELPRLLQVLSTLIRIFLNPQLFLSRIRLPSMYTPPKNLAANPDTF